MLSLGTFLIANGREPERLGTSGKGQAPEPTAGQGLCVPLPAALLEGASCLSALISPWDGHLGSKHVPEARPTLPRFLLLSMVEPSAAFFEGPVSSPP